MKLKLETKEKIQNRIANDMILTPEMKSLPRQLIVSIISVFSAALAGLEYRIISVLIHIFKNATPFSAKGIYLETWRIFKGIKKIQATPHILLLKLHRENNNEDIIIDKNLTITVVGKDVKFNPSEEKVLFKKDENSIEIECTSNIKGSEANTTGDELFFLGSAHSDIALQVEYVKAVRFGEDEEDEESLRERILSNLSNTPQGGNNEDFKRWMIESGVPHSKREMINGCIDDGLSGIKIKNSQLATFVNYQRWTSKDPTAIFPTSDEIEKMMEYINKVRCAAAVNFHIIPYHISKKVVIVQIEILNKQGVVIIDVEDRLREDFESLDFGQSSSVERVTSTLSSIIPNNFKLITNTDKEYQVEAGSLQLLVFGGISAK